MNNETATVGGKTLSTHRREFTRLEETVHAVTHGTGAILGIIGLIFLVIKASTATALLSSVIFGISLILLYAASGTFHASCAVWGTHKPSRFRDFTEKCDHSLIYLLILGTYAPACLSAMGGTVGYLLFALVATCCVLGFVLNVINVKRFAKISMVLYVISGWTIAAAIYPYYRAVGVGGIALLLAGGVSYTVGLLFYRARHIPYLHIVWHALVLLGSVLHFLMVYFYCI